MKDKKRHFVIGGPGDDSVVAIPIEKVRDAVQNLDAHKRRVHSEAKLLANLGYWVLPVARLEKGYAEKEFNANSASQNPKQIDEWFHPDKGKFSGFNLAIACGRKGGEGVVIADADRHGRGDGVQEWRDLVATSPAPPHPWAVTPNDGEHHVFQWHECFTKKSTKVDSSCGLEILGGKDGAFTAFVLVYPSVVKNLHGYFTQYEWTVHPRDCLPPPVPDAVISRYALRIWQPSPSSRGNENITESDLEQVIPIEQIERMLATINPNELTYYQWLSIGMAIHSQHQDALPVWDEWSRRGDRYKPDECTKRWKGFNAAGRDGRVTMGTLFFHAKQNGWEPTKDDKFCDPVSLAVARLNETYAHIVVSGGQDRILRLRPDHRIGELHYDLLAPAAFERMFAGRSVQNPGWQKPKLLTRAWLESPFRRSYHFGLQLAPNEQVRPGVFNTWNGFAYKPIEGDCSLLLNHIKDVICSRDDDLNTWLLDWAADCVQDPGKLKGTAIVMRGKEGTGKGTFANTLGKLFGPHFVHLTDAKHLMGNFNAHLIEAIVVFADEITWGGNIKSQGKLKGLVTESQLTGERKGIDAIQYRNLAHVIIASNSEWVIPAGPESRRWFVVDISDSHANDQAYFKAIHKQLNSGGYEAFLYFLQNRKITSNLRHAPETEALAEQRRLSASTRDKFYDYVEHHLAEGSWGPASCDHVDHGHCVSKQHVYEAYREYAKGHGGVALSNVSFWKLWLKVFPFAKGGQTEWPRSRHLGGTTRLAVLRHRKEMCERFANHFGTASDEVRNASEDWERWKNDDENGPQEQGAADLRPGTPTRPGTTEAPSPVAVPTVPDVPTSSGVQGKEEGE